MHAPPGHSHSQSAPAVAARHLQQKEGEGGGKRNNRFSTSRTRRVQRQGDCQAQAVRYWSVKSLFRRIRRQEAIARGQGLHLCRKKKSNTYCPSRIPPRRWFRLAARAPCACGVCGGVRGAPCVHRTPGAPYLCPCAFCACDVCGASTPSRRWGRGLHLPLPQSVTDACSSYPFCVSFQSTTIPFFHKILIISQKNRGDASVTVNAIPEMGWEIPKIKIPLTLIKAMLSMGMGQLHQNIRALFNIFSTSFIVFNPPNIN